METFDCVLSAVSTNERMRQNLL